VQHINFISPDCVSWFVSGDVLIAGVIGGIGTLVGGPLGAALLVLLKHALLDRSATGICSSASSSPAVALLMPKASSAICSTSTGSRAQRRRAARAGASGGAA
jgi:ABC-type branched-subunit amino acid transport system permease subunit